MNERTNVEAADMGQFIRQGFGDVHTRGPSIRCGHQHHGTKIETRVIRLTIHNPITDSRAILTDGDHPETVDAHWVVVVWRCEFGSQCFVCFFLLALVLDFPCNIDDFFDIGIREQPVYELAEDNQLRVAKTNRGQHWEMDPSGRRTIYNVPFQPMTCKRSRRPPRGKGVGSVCVLPPTRRCVRLGTWSKIGLL